MPCHCRSGKRHDLCRWRQRMVRAGGVEVGRPRRHLDAFQRGPRVPGGRTADQVRLEFGAVRGRALRGRRAGGVVSQYRWGRVLAACRGAARASLAAELAAGRWRADPAFAGAASDRCEAALDRHFRGRRFLYRGRWRHLAGAQPGHAMRLPAGRAALSGVRAVRSLRGDGAGDARSSVSAEPLRHVSQRGRRPALDQHRARAAFKFWVPRRGASARSGFAVPAAAEWRYGRPVCA